MGDPAAPVFDTGATWSGTAWDSNRLRSVRVDMSRTTEGDEGGTARCRAHVAPASTEAHRVLDAAAPRQAQMQESRDATIAGNVGIRHRARHEFETRARDRRDAALRHEGSQPRSRHVKRLPSAAGLANSLGVTAVRASERPPLAG